jgi:hypothetical protein
MVEQWRSSRQGGITLLTMLKTSLSQRHRRAEQQAICERFCGAFISDK